MNNLSNIINSFLDLDVNEFKEKKAGLYYLSWANAMREALKIYPDLKYEIHKNDDNLPIFGNDQLGYMVYTSVNIENQVRECWLPVLDYRNKVINKPNMFDVNKSLMRCLTKNLAMFGLGLYIYAGEDLPEEPKSKAKNKPENQFNAYEMTIIDDFKNKLQMCINEDEVITYMGSKNKGIPMCDTLSSIESDVLRMYLLKLCQDRKKELSDVTFNETTNNG